ncbi:MAG: hypothetical protein ACLP0J_25485 [Solirubrobacteraceae bacterium]
MSAGRTPQQALAELERELVRAFDREPPRRRRWRSWPRRTRVMIAAGAAVVLGASTAAATTSIFTSAPPIARLAPLAVDLGSGTVNGERWLISAGRCSGSSGAVSVLLRAGSGGAGSACGPAIGPPSTFYDPSRGVGLVFGVVPAGTARVEIVLGAATRVVAPVSADPDGLRAAGVTAGSRVYVAVVPISSLVTAMTAFDASGRLVLACSEGRCTRP